MGILPAAGVGILLAGVGNLLVVGDKQLEEVDILLVGGQDRLEGAHWVQGHILQHTKAIFIEYAFIFQPLFCKLSINP